MIKPLDISSDHWRSRWLVTPQWDQLHRIGTIVWDEDEDFGSMIQGQGQAVCGIAAHFQMPGIFSRMGLPRCSACCEALGIPPGNGAPFNQEEASWSDA